jgi:metal-dependent amidase/aminoacylase/carboxypeptidase family protein
VRASRSSLFRLGSYILQVVTIGKFEGGGAFNVIPDSVTIGGTFRAFLKDSFSKLKQRIEEVMALQLGMLFYFGSGQFIC